MIQSRFYVLLKERIEKHVDGLIDQLSAGQIGGDDAATVGMNYRQNVGRLQGLRDALAAADEINTEMNK